MAENEIDLSVVIVSWNCWEYLKECIKSIYDTIYNINYEIIVVDNNSNDNTVNNVAAFYPKVKLFPLEKNIGFPKANNIGFKHSAGKYLLALNPDTILSENSIITPLEFLKKNNNYGCAGIRQLKSNGTINLQGARKFPQLKGVLFTYLYLDKVFPNLKILNSMDMTYWDHNDSMDVELLSGAYILFPRKVYDLLGGFDESQEMYFEDIEFCYRIIKSGLKIRYINDVYFFHLSKKSSSKANPYWISSLRYSAIFKFIKLNEGEIISLTYAFFIAILFPVRILLLPILAIGAQIKQRSFNLKSLFIDSIYSFVWAIRQIF